MIFSRIIGALTALALLLVPASTANAILFSGATVSGGSGTLLTTMTIQNTSGSTQATNFVTQIFGHPFKKGDIANGCTTGAPKFELTNGTNVPFSEGLAPVCWSDGSLKWAPFMLRVPTSIAGSGSLTINIKTGGTFPSASSRGTSDLTSGGTDLNVSVTGIGSGLSGTWVSNLAQGITAAHTDDYNYMNGDAGWCGRVRASFRQSSADHGQLEAYWYACATETGSGLGGIRYLARVTQPWYNIDTPTKDYRVFSAFTLLNGASTVRDMMSGHFGAGKTFTWSSGNTLNSTTTNFETSWLVRFTTTGALPTGLSTGTDYFVHYVNANDFQVATNSSGAITGPSYVAPSGAGSGTHTATAYPVLPMFTSIFTAGTDGKYDYLQAGGSVASDSTTRIAFNNTYWRLTKLIPPYDFGTISPSNNSTTTYYPQAAGPLERNVSQTGERGDIGLFTHWAATHLYNQDAADEQNIRVISLAGGGFPVTLRHKTNFTIPVANNTTYTGMPASNTSLVWNAGNGTATGFTAPSNGSTITTAGFTTFDTSHMADLHYYALLFTGEPQNNDMMTDTGSMNVINHLGFLNPGTATVDASTNAACGISNNGPGNRNCVINGTTYYGTNLGVGNGLRTQAWMNRDVANAAGIAGGYEPAGAKTREYLSDIINTIYTSYNAYTGLLPSYANTNGMWGEGGGLNSHIPMWQLAYLQMTVGHTAAITENSAALTFGTYTAKFEQFIYTNGGNSVWAIPAYNAYIRTGVSNSPAGNSDYNPYLTAAGGYSVCGVSSVNWSSGSATFTQASALVGSYVPANNDRVLFGAVDANCPQGATPGTFSGYTTYYMVNVSGSTFQLSATQGGSAITPNDNGSGQAFSIYPANLNNGSNVAGSSNIMYSTTGAMNILTAATATVDSSTRGAMNTNLQAQPGYSSSIATDNLKYSFTTSY
jgi:hypothetical protein